MRITNFFFFSFTLTLPSFVSLVSSSVIKQRFLRFSKLTFGSAHKKKSKKRNLVASGGHCLGELLKKQEHEQTAHSVTDSTN